MFGTRTKFLISRLRPRGLVWATTAWMERDVREKETDYASPSCLINNYAKENNNKSCVCVGRLALTAGDY